MREAESDAVPLPMEETTIGELFQQSGYRIELIGSWLGLHFRDLFGRDADRPVHRHSGASK